MNWSVVASPLQAQMRMAVLKMVLSLLGFVPVLCISLHVLGVVPLRNSVWALAFPAVVLALLLTLAGTGTAQIMRRGWLWGLAAVALYDIGRIPFIMAGWEDFIPHIGDWLLNRDGSPAWVGYAWRYIGNGGGMGISFAFLVHFLPRKNMLRTGICYGLFVFLCLMFTIVIAPEKNIMFTLTPLTFTGSLVGHIIYGTVLGLLQHYHNRAVTGVVLPGH